METKGFFSIWNHYKFLIQLFPIHLNTYIDHYKYFYSLQRGDRFLNVRI